MLVDLFQIKNHHQCELLNCSVHRRANVTNTGCEKLSLPETTSDVCAAVCATVVDTAQ